MGRVLIEIMQYLPNTIYIYTDGSCCNHKTSYKRGYGGCGVVLLFNDQVKFVTEAHNNTTSARMELLAVIRGLSLLKTLKYPIVVRSDAQYIINTINKGWLKSWKRLNFTTCKNADLWKQFWNIYVQLDHTKITFEWVKGHANEFGNELADHLAGFGYSTLVKFHELQNVIKKIK